MLQVKYKFSALKYKLRWKCFHIISFTDTIEEFKQLFNREDLFLPSLTYDTNTFKMNAYNLSILTYRQTEFEELPMIPLMFMIHEDKLGAAHNFFFMRLEQLIPELETTETMITITENDENVINAIKKYCPHISMLRNWQHALKDIKKNLEILEITDEKEVKEYESDFMRLLDQESMGDYKSILAQMYLKKWKRVKKKLFIYLICLKNLTLILFLFVCVFFKDFSNYFDEHIDCDMNIMAAWALRSFGLSLDSIDSHSNESFYLTMKQFDGWKSYSVDMMVICFMRIDEFFMDKITRGRLNMGDYTLREHLSDSYCQDDVVAEAISVDQLINSIECEMKSRRSMRKRMNGIKRPSTAIEVDTKEENEKRRAISQVCIVKCFGKFSWSIFNYLFCTLGCRYGCSRAARRRNLI